MFKFDTVYLKDKNIVIGSDFHLDHDKEFIFAKRGFSSPETHKIFILNKLAELDKDTILIYLGDLALNSSVEKVLGYFKFFPKTYYIFGNHENYTGPIYRQAVANLLPDAFHIFPTTHENITFCGYQQYMVIDKQPVVFSHMALKHWLYKESGSYNICGHSHGDDVELLPECLLSRNLDVGVDVALKFSKNKKPYFTWREIVTIVNAKKFSNSRH